MMMTEYSCTYIAHVHILIMQSVYKSQQLSTTVTHNVMAVKKIQESTQCNPVNN